MTALLTSKDVARFVARGFLRYEALLGPELCQGLLDDIRTGQHSEGCEYGLRLSEAWPAAPSVRAIFAEPRMQAVITSLLGDDPIYDHHFPHISEPGERRSDDLHQDAIRDGRQFAFDLQISIFPQATTHEMGGTLIVPGSHLRRVNERDIGRYQHVAGQEQIVCPAGTVVFWHNNLWHSGRSNRSSFRRVMFKVRLRPRVRQHRSWDVSDLQDPEVYRILSENEPWHGVDGRIEIMNRLALFRYLSGDDPGPSAPHFAHYFNTT